MFDFLLKRIDAADDKAALQRVQTLRAERPEASVDELADTLIMRKCRQAAAIGAATASAGLIPGVGTLASVVVGTAADIGATMRLQAELILEIAALHGQTLGEDERRRVVMLVAGLNAGTGRLLSKGGTRIATHLSQRFAQRWVMHALPFAGMAASAATNVLYTYLIGRRAHAYFQRGPAAMGSWWDNVQALTGLDERKLREWTAGSWDAAGNLARGALTGTATAAQKVAGGTIAASNTVASSARRSLTAGVGAIRRLDPRAMLSRRNAKETPPELPAPLEAGALPAPQEDRASQADSAKHDESARTPAQ